MATITDDGDLFMFDTEPVNETGMSDLELTTTDDDDNEEEEEEEELEGGIDDDHDITSILFDSDDILDRADLDAYEDGDLLYVRVFYMNNGYVESMAAPMEVIKIYQTEEDGRICIEMIYVRDETRKVYRGVYRQGDIIEISTAAAPRIVNGLEYHNFRFDPKPKIDSKLVRMGKATKACVEAKFDAYLDPTIAALSETPGRITRRRAYPSIV